MDILMVYVTFPSAEEAQSMVNGLMVERYVACGNILPVQSCYEWNGANINEGEYVALMKSDVARKKDIERFSEKNHSYENPCILFWTVEASEAYGKWVAAACRNR